MPHASTEWLYLVLNAQDRWCFAGCRELYPVRWKESMPLLPR